MRLSEELKQLNDCGDAGKMVEGFAERCELLEDDLRTSFYFEASKDGAGHNEAMKYAENRMAKY